MPLPHIVNEKELENYTPILINFPAQTSDSSLLSTERTIRSPFAKEYRALLYADRHLTALKGPTEQCPWRILVEILMFQFKPVTSAHLSGFLHQFGVHCTNSSKMIGDFYKVLNLN